MLDIYSHLQVANCLPFFMNFRTKSAVKRLCLLAFSTFFLVLFKVSPVNQACSQMIVEVHYS